jgi:hypothetical protein
VFFDLLLTYSTQGFRSTPGPSAGSLDAEFHVFQAGSALGSQFPFQYEPAHAFGRQAQPALPEWASAFQALNLNESNLPISPSLFRQAAPLERNIAGSWHQEFLLQQSQQLSQPPQQGVFSHSYGSPTWQPLSQLFPSFHSSQSSLSARAQQKQPAQQTSVDTFDEAAFERAFATAGLELLSQDEVAETIGKSSTAHHLHQDEPDHFDMSNACLEPGDILGGVDLNELLGDASFEENNGLLNFDFDSFLEEPRHQAFQETLDVSAFLADMSELTGHSDLDHIPLNSHGMEDIHDFDSILTEPTNQVEQLSPDAEADELSRTAGQLLTNLQHEHNEKFANSSFLALMRQLRDKEVRVEGDKVVDVSTSRNFFIHISIQCGTREEYHY